MNLDNKRDMISGMINSIIHADCMDILRALPDKCVDLVLTDPPYGDGKGGLGLRFGGRFEKFDIQKINAWDIAPSEELFREIFRISKNQIIWGGNYFGLKGKSWLCWDKGEGFMGRSYGEHELAWTSHDSPARIFKYDPLGTGCYRGKIHPTQKPLALWEWCMRNYSEPGDLILDPFSGSGTTAIAAHRLGRRFVCIEKDEEYHAASVERLAEEKKQARLDFSAIVPPASQMNLFDRKGN